MEKCLYSSEFVDKLCKKIIRGKYTLRNVKLIKIFFEEILKILLQTKCLFIDTLSTECLFGMKLLEEI